MTKLISLLVSAIIPKLSGWLRSLWSRWRQRKDIKEKNKKVTDQLKKAETKEERENAARSVIDNF